MSSSSEARSQAHQSSTEGNILQTLASIKSEVSSVIQQIQRAKLSAEESIMSSSNPSTQQLPEGSTEIGQQGENPELSRDEVKAQREAKKAAKAARKNKSLGGQSEGPTPIKSESEGSQKLNKTPKPAKAEGTPDKKQPPVSTGTPKPPKASENVKEQKQKKPAGDKNNVKSPEELKTPKNASAEQSKPKIEDSSMPSVTANTGDGTTDVPSTEKIVPKIDKAAEKLAQFEMEMEKVHPMFKELGLKYSKYIIRGSNDRTTALLHTIKEYIRNYKTPEGKEFKQDFSSQLQFLFDKLKHYRPFAVGMSTAIDGINGAIRALEDNLPDSDKRDELVDWCERFEDEKITKAVEAIAVNGSDKIKEGDTIMAFSLTDAIFNTFKLAGEQDKKFSLLLIVTRSNNYLHEFKQLKNMMGREKFKDKVNVSFINISSIMSMMSSVDKVFLGGHALFTTGGVMAHAGASTLALCASHHNIPVIFFCETFKFCDKSPTDAFYSDVFPENLFGLSTEADNDNSNKNGESSTQPFKARICYDVTPVNLVTCVITDIDMLPSCSVPVVLRVQETRPLSNSAQTCYH